MSYFNPLYVCKHIYANVSLLCFLFNIDTFRCDNGICVGKSHVCDDENNCGDNSDERDCGK